MTDVTAKWVMLTRLPPECPLVRAHAFYKWRLFELTNPDAVIVDSFRGQPLILLPAWEVHEGDGWSWSINVLTCELLTPEARRRAAHAKKVARTMGYVPK